MNIHGYFTQIRYENAERGSINVSLLINRNERGGPSEVCVSRAGGI
jgi:hypothetical protein